MSNTTETASTEIEITVIEASRPMEARKLSLFTAAYNRATRLGEKGDECVMCGKRTNQMIHVDSETQGLFPVGPSCAKKLIKDGWSVEIGDMVAYTTAIETGDKSKG